MMKTADWIESEFERLAQSPEGIPKLREFVLQLAVQGKLVPQDSKDEPASELLKRIAAQKEQLVKDGKIKKSKPLPEIEEDEIPFEIPASWGYVRLIDVVAVQYGFAFPSRQFNTSKIGMPLIRIRDISQTDTQAYFEGDFDKDYLVPTGDYLVGMDGDFNIRKWQGPSALLNQRVCRFHTWRDEVIADYVVRPLQIILNHLHSGTSYTTVKHLSAKQINGIFIPLPPLAEQKRIVAKVDELMALCDELEAKQTAKAQTKEALNGAALHHVRSATNPAELASATRFYIGQMDTLTDVPQAIPPIRETILQLAVQGKLVPQDPNDEPASELLKRIAAEKEQLVKDGKIKKGKPLPPVKEDELPFEVPEGWEWEMTDDISDPQKLTTYGILKPVWVSDGVPTVRISEMRSGVIDLDRLRQCDPVRAEKFEKTRLFAGDILVTKDGTIGKTAIVPAELEGGNITQHVIRLGAHRCLDQHYVRIAIDSPVCQAWMRGETKGVALKGVNVGDFRRMPIPVPPLAEQHRIVAKVDELMALCDQLEARLTTAQDLNQQLTQAILTTQLNGN